VNHGKVVQGTDEVALTGNGIAEMDSAERARVMGDLDKVKYVNMLHDTRYHWRNRKLHQLSASALSRPSRPIIIFWIFSQTRRM
jgi:hypothetical protein